MAFRFVDKTIDDFKVGDRYSFSKTVTEADVVVFAAISGDMSPLHVNAEYAKTTPYGERIAHGLLTASLVSAALGRMVSPGFLLESCQFQFVAPVRLGDTVVATAEVLEKDPQQSKLKLRVVCTNQRDEVVLEGSAIQAAVKAKQAG
ncbi:MAG: MaoC family dehydratase [Sphingomonadaceae bacterium]